MRQVFGVTLTGPDAEVTSPKSETGEYTNLSELSQVGTPAAKGYQTAAKKVAAQAVMNLTTLLPCASATPDVACVEKFIRTKVARAYRRALADVEVQDLMTVYNAAGTDGPAVGVRLLLEAALQAPSFVYRTELGTAVGDSAATTRVPLKPYEESPARSASPSPSPHRTTRFGQSEDGTLAQPEVLGAEVDRLMAMPDAQATLTKKTSFWLGVERILGTTKDAMLFPEYNAALQAALHQSATMFVNDLVWVRAPSPTCSLANASHMNGLLAQVYGVAGITGNDMVAVDSTTGERSSGIPLHPARRARRLFASEPRQSHPPRALRLQQFGLRRDCRSPAGGSACPRGQDDGHRTRACWFASCEQRLQGVPRALQSARAHHRALRFARSLPRQRRQGSHRQHIDHCGAR